LFFAGRIIDRHGRPFSRQLAGDGRADSLGCAGYHCYFSLQSFGHDFDSFSWTTLCYGRSAPPALFIRKYRLPANLFHETYFHKKCLDSCPFPRKPSRRSAVRMPRSTGVTRRPAKSAMARFKLKVLAVLAAIPEGRVTTYGIIGMHLHASARQV